MNSPTVRISMSTWGMFVLLCIAGALCAITPQAALPALLAAALLLAIFLQKPLYGIYTLVIASMLSLFALKLSNGITIRPDQVVTLILLAMLMLQFAAGTRPIIRTPLTWLILAYLLINIISSLVNSPDVRMSLQRCLLLAVTFAGYFVTAQLIPDKKTFQRVFKLLIAAGLLEALYGIISVPLMTHGIEIGGAERPYLNIYARGTFLEGNLFGSFEMMIGLILLSFLLSSYFKKYRAALILMFGTTLIASLMSFTRAAWLGLLLGSIVLLLMRRNIASMLLQNLQYVMLLLIIGSVASYVMLTTFKFGNYTLLEVYQQRLQNLLQYQSGSGSQRMMVWKAAIHLWQQNPLLGNGTDSIKVLGSQVNIPIFGASYWIPNSVLLALHDTGLVGLFLFLAIQVQLMVHLWKARNRTTHAYWKPVLEGLLIAFIGAQLASLFTNAFWLIFIWIFMGIASSAARLSTGAGTDANRN